MSLKEKLTLCGMVAATVIVALVIWGFVSPVVSRHSAPGSFTSGAAGNLLIEQYDPYVQQNGGINTALPMTISGALTSSGGQTLSGNAANTGTLTQGSTGTAITRENFGTCNLNSGGSSAAIAAWATIAWDCGTGATGATALTGVTAGDTVLLDLATTTPQTLNSLRIAGVAASSTPGFIVVSLTNASSSAITMIKSATSSLPYMVLK